MLWSENAIRQLHLTTILFLGLALAAPAASAGNPFYLTAKAGSTTLDGDLANAFRAIGDDDASWSFGVGFRLGKHLAFPYAAPPGLEVFLPAFLGFASSPQATLCRAPRWTSVLEGLENWEVILREALSSVVEWALVFDEHRKEPAMQWSEIRRHYPDRWLLIEAIEARSEAGRRLVDDIAVLGAFPDSVTAMKRYTGLHHEAPHRELYVCHTARQELEIRERRWLGIRCALSWRFDRSRLRNRGRGHGLRVQLRA